MKKWWKRKREKMRRGRKEHQHYTVGDFVFDVLLWVPELFLLPFRMVYWFLRGAGRATWHFFDGF